MLKTLCPRRRKQKKPSEQNNGGLQIRINIGSSKTRGMLKIASGYWPRTVQENVVL